MQYPCMILKQLKMIQHSSITPLDNFHKIEKLWNSRGGDNRAHKRINEQRRARKTERRIAKANLQCTRLDLEFRLSCEHIQEEVEGIPTCRKSGTKCYRLELTLHLFQRQRFFENISCS